MRHLLAATAFCVMSATAQAAPIFKDVAIAPGGLFGTIGSAQVAISFSGTPSRNLTADAGAFNIKLNDPATPTISEIVTAFCVDIFNTLTLPGRYTQAPPTTTALSAARASQLNALLTKAFTVVTDAVTSAAMQTAIWEVVNETGSMLNLSTGAFKATSSTANVISTATTYLANISGANPLWKADTNGTINYLTPYSTPTVPYSSQTLAYITFSSSPPATGVPEPATIAVLGLGLLGLGALRRRTLG